MSPATRRDFANALTTAWLATGRTNKIYELCGDTAFTLAAEASSQVSQRVLYSDLPKDTYMGILNGSGLPPGLPEVIAAAGGWFRSVGLHCLRLQDYDRFRLKNNGGIMSRTIGFAVKIK
ncbi:MAG: hypothetical protein RIB41_12190 [Oceanibaculum nanhaiense]|uniref:hypothetical protein n=1 Tax=Oceanibaculum nanhaiense TaxID=1909734 RepID=UPI0032EB8FFF